MHPREATSQKAFTRFVGAIHESLEVERVGSNYMASIRDLVQANAYGFYLLTAKGGRPQRVAVSGGVDRFIARYENVGYSQDPLLRYMLRTKEPVHDGLLYSESEWQLNPLRRALTMQYQAPRMLEAPLVIDGRLKGTLYFTRRPDSAPPFGNAELETLRLVARHVCSAVDHALRYAEVRERCGLAESALDSLDVPLLLSDVKGDVKFANRAAKSTLRAAGAAAGDEHFREALQENLDRLAGGSQSTTATFLRLPTAGKAERYLLLRSTPVPALEHTVATFLCATGKQHATRNFDHLRPLLSERELDVLELLAEGLQNKEIATRLFVTTNTVKYHVKRMYRTMRVSSRAELLSKAYADTNGDHTQR
ncbi:MAG: LuxR C-terminal-related transcriptional regulator [Thermoleophilia bacterium]|nr:LuxR C-terminal-related transcriptional regulator [Thermoleophilia bacterium]